VFIGAVRFGVSSITVTVNPTASRRSPKKTLTTANRFTHLFPFAHQRARVRAALLQLTDLTRAS